MPQLNFTIPADLLDRIDAAKPDFLDRKGFICLLLTSAIDKGTKLPAYRVGAGTHQAVTAVDSELGRSEAEASQTETTAVDGLPGIEDFDQGFEPKKKQGFLGTKKGDDEDLVDQLLVTPRERGTNPRAKSTNPRSTGTNPRANDTNPKALRDPFTRRKLDLDLIPDDLLDCQQLLPEFWASKKGTRSQAVFTRVCNKLRQWDPEQRREALERAIASGWGDVFEPPAARASQGALPLTNSGTPMTVSEQIAARAIANIRAMEERRAAA